MKKLTLGLFIGSTEDSYGQALIRGAYSVTQSRKARLVVFTSGTLRSYHGFEAQRNVLFDLAGAHSVDTLVMAGSLSHSVPSEEMEHFCNLYKPIPLVSLAVAVPGIPTILTDNRPGMESLMTHLLEHHKYRKIAYIGGPQGQQEADVRYQVYRAALEKSGISEVPSWTLMGDYTRDSGRRAMEELLRRHPSPEFEGLVVANDSMALGALEVLLARGFRVPEDLFITGFDDMDESRFGVPPLTTVRQSAFLQAQRGAALALDLLVNTDPTEALSNLPAHLVVRRSCGCSGRNEICTDENNQQRSMKKNQFANLLKHKTTSEPTFIEEWRAFLREEPVLEESTCLQEFLDTLWSENQLSEPEIFRLAHGSLTEEIQRREAQLRFLSIERSGILNSSAETLLLSHDLPSVFNVLAINLPKLGFSSCHLSLFQDPRHPKTKALLHLNYTYLGRAPLPPGGLPFDPQDLIPGGLDSLDQESSLLVVEALHSKSEGMGFVVFGTNLEGSQLTGSLRSQISSALQSVLLLENLRTRNLDLTQTMEELRLTQVQLVQSEKMAALGNLVAGVAHEINTPLGVALTGATFSHTKVKTLLERMGEGVLKKSELETGLRDLQESSGLIETNLQRAADLVQSFKQIASDQTSEHRRRFKLLAYIDEILLSLAPQWKYRPLSVTSQGPSELVVDSYPGALAQIVTNFLMNTLSHGFEKDQEGHVVVKVSQEGNTAKIQFQDDGQGIAKENLEKIFDPFFTTKRGSGGTGLGLHIVYNLVTGLLGGSLRCESTLGVGTNFIVEIPLLAPHLENIL